MADVAPEGAGFWLPAEFFAEDDVDVMKDQEKLLKPDMGSYYRFPPEFPYDFHSGNREHVEKAASWVMSTSPQSTLGNWLDIGSPNRAPIASAPVAGGSSAVVDLICKAAGQVAKMNSGDGLRPFRNSGLVGPPRIPAQIYSSTRNPSPPIFQHSRALPRTTKQDNPGGGMWYGTQKQVHDYRSGKAVGRVLEQAAWPVKQNPTRNICLDNRAFEFGGPSGGDATAKRVCTGTGVFLPRAYGISKENSCNAYSSESHRKPVYPTSLLQERNDDPLLKNFENMKAALVQSLPRPRYSGGFDSDYDLLMARRNSIMLQYQKSLLISEKLAIGRDNYSPQDLNW